MIQGTFRSNFLLFGVPLGLSIGGERGEVLAGEIITLGTLLSILTMFVFITLARSFGWI